MQNDQLLTAILGCWVLYEIWKYSIPTWVETEVMSLDFVEEAGFPRGTAISQSNLNTGARFCCWDGPITGPARNLLWFMSDSTICKYCGIWVIRKIPTFSNVSHLHRQAISVLFLHFALPQSQKNTKITRKFHSSSSGRSSSYVLQSSICKIHVNPLVVWNLEVPMLTPDCNHQIMQKHARNMRDSAHSNQYKEGPKFKYGNTFLAYWLTVFWHSIRC